MIIFDLLRPNWLETSKKFHSYRTSLLTLMNRFLIKHPLNILEILRSIFLVFYISFKKFLDNEKVEEFVGSWIYSMKEISSGNAWFLFSFIIELK